MAPKRHSFIHWPRRLLDWLCEGRPDYREFRQRRASRVYQSNRGTCLLVWLAAALMLLVCGSVGCLVTLGLVASLFCFSLLDPD